MTLRPRAHGRAAPPRLRRRHLFHNGFVAATNSKVVKGRVLRQEGIGLDQCLVVACNAVATLFSYPGGEP